MRYNDPSNIPVKCRLCRFCVYQKKEKRCICTHTDGKDFVLACCAWARKRTETAQKATKTSKTGKPTRQGANALKTQNGGEK